MRAAYSRVRETQLTLARVGLEMSLIRRSTIVEATQYMYTRHTRLRYTSKARVCPTNTYQPSAAALGTAA